MLNVARRAEGLPVVLFSYFNPILQYGIDRFARAAAGAGVAAVIVPDIPLEESETLGSVLHERGLDMPLLVAPSTGRDRARRIADRSAGFVYVVSRTGVTGAGRVPDFAAANARLVELRALTDKPLAAGFGVSRPEHVAQIAPFADGVIVGSALIDAYWGSSGAEAAQRVFDLATRLRAADHAADAPFGARARAERVMRVVDEAEVARVLTPAAVRGLMRDVFLAEARGRTSNPVRSMAAAPKGWLGAMPAYVDTGDLRGLGAKIVAFFPGNAEFDEPTHRATIAMLDPDRGELLALVAGETITERRTAAVSVVATQRLAARPKGRHAILGAGLQGHAHLTAFADAGMVESLSIWSRNGAHAEALVAYARTLGIADARVSASPAEAVHEAAS